MCDDCYHGNCDKTNGLCNCAFGYEGQSCDGKCNSTYDVYGQNLHLFKITVIKRYNFIAK